MGRACCERCRTDDTNDICNERTSAAHSLSQSRACINRRSKLINQRRLDDRLMLMGLIYVSLGPSIAAAKVLYHCAIIIIALRWTIATVVCLLVRRACMRRAGWATYVYGLLSGVALGGLDATSLTTAPPVSAGCQSRRIDVDRGAIVSTAPRHPRRDQPLRRDVCPMSRSVRLSVSRGRSN